MGDWFHDTALSGSLVLAVPVALVAGLVSFFSPVRDPAAAGLPLLRHRPVRRRPRDDAPRRGRMLARRRCCSCSASPSSSSSSAALSARWAPGWSRSTASSPSCSASSRSCSAWPSPGWCRWLQRDWRVHQVPAVGLAAAPLLGFLFGLGWTPCIGPTLGAITMLSYNEATAGRGALLSAFYALGLGLPFIARRRSPTAACSARSAWVRRHQLWVTRLGGLMLVVVGVLLVTGWWDRAGRRGSRSQPRRRASRCRV